MKCMNCGANIPEDQMICPGCGQEVQIVPDYNPLDDVLAAEVKGAVSKTMAIHLNQEDGVRRNTGRTSGGNSGNRGTAGHTARKAQDERKLRRRRAEKKKMLAKKKKKRAMLIGIVATVLMIAAGVLLYQTSYTGRVRKGYRLIKVQKYDEALSSFRKAVSKSPKRSDAYTGLSKVYIAQDELEQAEKIFLDAVEEQPSNVEIYRAAIQFYIETKQESKVSELLDECSSDKVLAELEDFVSEVPEFSLDDTEVFDDVQALELTGTGKAIYYTTDGTNPTTSSRTYTEPIKLDEGKTEVRAISVNKKGIPSLVESRTYTVEFPIEEAPSVTPSTGQYDSAQTIEVIVPDKYEAYYTTDGSNPDPENNPETHKYTGPIEMPEGNTIFSFVLVDQRGRISDVTKRNYELLSAE